MADSSLTIGERRKLAEHEAVIESGVKSFFAIGNALIAIRDNGLYTDVADTFEGYCKKRWNFAKSHAYRLIESAKVMDVLSPMGDIPAPDNERQVRVLADLETPQEQVTVWTKAVETAPKDKEGNPKVTAAHIKKVAEELLGGPDEPEEESEPDPEAWLEPLQAPFKKAVKDINEALRVFGKLAEKKETGVYLAKAWSRFETAYIEIKTGMNGITPWADCPHCKHKGCKECDGCGWITKHAYNTLPQELRVIASGFQFRDYQDDCHASVKAAFEKYDSVLIELATGLGKTEVGIRLANEWEDGRVLFIAHTKELVQQPARKIKLRTGWLPEVEQGSLYANETAWGRGQIVVASKASLHKNRLTPNRFQDIGLLIVDECFPAGTKIDGKPIEQICRGDVVNSFNHGSQSVEQRLVLDVMKSKATAICRLTLATGKTIICTPGHPFYVPGVGYVPAAHLFGKSVLLKGAKYATDCTSTSAYALRDLRHDGYSAEFPYAHGQSVLLERMSQTEVGTNSVGNEHPLSVGTHEGEEPDAQGRYSSQVGTIEGSEDGFERSGDGGPWEGQRLSDVLQARHGDSSREDRNRSRWTLARLDRSPDAGQKEAGVFGIERVASVAVYKPGCGREFERLCPGGYVFNLEVDGNHNYFADDFLVHNCHRAAINNRSYQDIIDNLRARNPKLKVLGMTATAKRHDKSAMSQVFEHVAFRMPILEGIEKGWLVPVENTCKQIKSMDFTEVKMTRKGDFHEDQLAKIIEQDKTLHEIASVTMQEGGAELKTLVFCPSVDAAEALCRMLNEGYQARAGWVCGDERRVSKEDRANILTAFHYGELNILVNVAVLTEGWDEPSVEHIVMAQPTASTPRYVQMLGRGTRPLPGVVDFPGSTPELRKEAIAESAKPTLRVTDLVDASLKHFIVSSVDVLSGEVDARVVQRAKENILAGSGRESIDAATARAQFEIEEEDRERKEREEAAREAEAKRRASLYGKAEYASISVDPFGANKTYGGTKPKRTVVGLFGMYKGVPLNDIPTNGLIWFTHKSTQPWFMNAVKNEILRRNKPLGNRPPMTEQALQTLFDKPAERKPLGSTSTDSWRKPSAKMPVKAASIDDINRMLMEI